MNNWNLTNVDEGCKRALLKLLRPKFYNSIELWLCAASEQEKHRLLRMRDIVEAHQQKRPHSGSSIVPFELATRTGGGRVVANQRRAVRAPVEQKASLDRCQRNRSESLRFRPRSRGQQHHAFEDHVEVSKHFSLASRHVEDVKSSLVLSPWASRAIILWQTQPFGDISPDDLPLVADVLASLHRCADSAGSVAYPRDEPMARGLRPRSARSVCSARPPTARSTRDVEHVPGSVRGGRSRPQSARSRTTQWTEDSKVARPETVLTADQHWRQHRRPSTSVSNHSSLHFSGSRQPMSTTYDRAFGAPSHSLRWDDVTAMTAAAG
mmetsp:Transcript_50515/g.110510  ORF Transcript_50515/g.110510 Transcript_50515/m.110510 type:complete len:323 (+) Transcript_50515:50-1018(+)|eukprot:CAMPEP_0204269674 /NCGR_PEP_ID=MMETSP0468-20130131/16862_1 /ASSEMBLY_ACC=CAM_ASM_000383 /TAXON_ID=2969 /ORGANISM="Oxyrrhis marina" /LENGTH=322 /DNA_ID=CAMNT_0051245097 /DNA_START=50 /DNA_END=1018 /DNA_ORIENTATION=+